MGRSSKRWVREHERDAFVRQARHSHYRSRAVYKLQEIDERDHLLRRDQVVVDLGAAPGSWSQYACERVGNRGRVIAVDILPLKSIENLTFIEGDFTEQKTVDRCLSCLGGSAVDLVISDMAPNITGIMSTDQMRSLELAERVLEFSKSVLKPEGKMLVKVFQGPGTDAFKKRLNEVFQRVISRKPRASKDSSREFYILALGYHV